jgi:hypothetical protein
MAKQTAAVEGTSMEDVNAATPSTALEYKRTAYEVRMDALDCAIRTNSDNRSIGPEEMISAAVLYEKFLQEANTGE